MSLQELRNAIVADGVVDADEVTLLETELYADGVIDQDEASILFEINDAVSGNANSPEWGDFFVRAVTDFVLQDETSPGVVDDDEAAFLINSVLADGTVDDLERALLTNIREQATSLSAVLTDKLTELGI